MKKRILSLALALALALAFIPAVPAVAADINISIGFEDGTLGGIEPLGAKLTVTTEQARSGSRSLLVTERTQNHHGAGIRVEKSLTADTMYEMSAWVRFKTPVTDTIKITLQIGSGGAAQWIPVSIQTVSNNGWTQLVGRYTVSPADVASGFALFYIESFNATAEFYIDDFYFGEPVSAANIRAGARLPSLKDAYNDHFLIGGIFDVVDINDLYLPLFKRHFNAMTPPLYSPGLAATKGNYTFSWIDPAVKRLGDEGFNLFGHVLVWGDGGSDNHASWLTNNADGSPLTRAEAITNMTDYINTVAGHYKGQLAAWDVVNEAFERHLGETPWREALTTENEWWNSPWWIAFENGADKSKGESGADYIEYAFRLARAADPGAFLIYNDDAMHRNIHMAHSVADMVKEINGKWLAEGNTRLLIEGVGLQTHLNLPEAEKELYNDFEEVLQIFADMGVRISITEMDISLFDWHQTGTPTQALYEAQAKLYAETMLLFKKYSEYIDRVTLWGLNDNKLYPYGQGWLHDCYPFLFNNDYTPKLAYFAVIDPEGYLAGNFDTQAKRDAWVKANSLPDPDAPPLFGDLAGVSAEGLANIEYVFENGLMSGSGGNFMPTQAARNAQFLAILSRLAGAGVTDGSPWFAPYVDWARNFGIIGDEDFSADGDMAREDMALWMYRYITISGIELPSRNGKPDYQDIAGLSEEQRVAAEALFDWGIITGATRGEVFGTGASSERVALANVLARFVRMLP